MSATMHPRLNVYPRHQLEQLPKSVETTSRQNRVNDSHTTFCELAAAEQNYDGTPRDTNPTFAMNVPQRKESEMNYLLENLQDLFDCRGVFGEFMRKKRENFKLMPTDAGPNAENS